MSKQAAFSLTIGAGAKAFGDGAHASTKGALAALESLAGLQGFRCALDMGCGSGILGLQAAYQWHIPVLCADIQAAAVDATQENACLNGLEPLVHVIRSDGFSHPQIAKQAPYDLIIANILAEILVPMASDVAAHASEEGIVLLSGILRWQEPRVVDAYRAVGLTLLQRITVEDWVSLLWQKQ